MPQGAKPGERRGGRPKGGKNLRTIEREIIRQKIIESGVPLAKRTAAERQMERDASAVAKRAEVAAVEIQRAAQAGVPLAKDALNTFLGLFMNRAGYFSPRPGEPDANGNRAETNKHANEDKFEKWARLSVETARYLAPYQSPTFRAIVVAPPPPSMENQTRRFTLAVFDNTNGHTIEAMAQADDLPHEEEDDAA